MTSQNVEIYSSVCFVEKESDRKMTKEHIFRAGLDVALFVESVKGKAKGISIPKSLPVEIGGFRIDKSPNYEFYLSHGERLRTILDLDPGLLDEVPDISYPISVLYVETSIKGKDSVEAEDVADDDFEDLEAMMRLFKMGDVYISRNRLIGTKFGEGMTGWYMYNRPIRTKPERLYHRHNYLVSDTDLDGFRQYFCNYWEIVRSRPKRIYNAIKRFSASYAERSSADRLLELVIAMESLFGDRSDSITYKLALRTSCFLYPPGKDRKETFEKVRSAYGDRGGIIHGDRLEAKYTDEEIDDIEELIRKAINKFLEYDVNGKRISSVEELDSILFFENE